MVIWVPYITRAVRTPVSGLDPCYCWLPSVSSRATYGESRFNPFIFATYPGASSTGYYLVKFLSMDLLVSVVARTAGTTIFTLNNVWGFPHLMTLVTSYMYLRSCTKIFTPYPRPTLVEQGLKRRHDVAILPLIEGERTEVLDRQGMLSTQRDRVGLMAVRVEVFIHLIVMTLQRHQSSRWYQP